MVGETSTHKRGTEEIRSSEDCSFEKIYEELKQCSLTYDIRFGSIKRGVPAGEIFFIVSEELKGNGFITIKHPKHRT